MKKLIKIFGVSAVMVASLASFSAHALYPINKDQVHRMWSPKGAGQVMAACKFVYQWAGRDRDIVNVQVNGFRIGYMDPKDHGKDISRGYTSNPQDYVNRFQARVLDKTYNSDTGALRFKLCIEIDNKIQRFVRVNPIAYGEVHLTYLIFDLD